MIADPMILAETDDLGRSFIEEFLLAFVRRDLFVVIHSPEYYFICKSDRLQY